MNGKTGIVVLCLLAISATFGAFLASNNFHSGNSSSKKEQFKRLRYCSTPIAKTDQVPSVLFQRCSAFLKPNMLQDTGQLVHALLAFSQLKDRPEFQKIGYEKIIDRLLTNQNGRSPRFGITRHGIKFFAVKDYGKDGESHPYQALAVLAELGISKNRVIEVGDQQFTVADLLADCEAMFTTDGEFEWAVVALLLYSPDRTFIKNRFGNRYSLDDIAKKLLARAPGIGPCVGCHVVDALMILQWVSNSGNRSLSEETRKRIEEYFSLLESFLPSIQDENGAFHPSWGRMWASSSAYQKWRRVFDPDFDWKQHPYPPAVDTLDWKVIATTHHLKWMMLRCEKKTLDTIDFRAANDFLSQSISTLMSQSERTRRSQMTRPSYCPMSHGLHILSLLNRDDMEVSRISFRKEADSHLRSSQ